MDSLFLIGTLFNWYFYFMLQRRSVTKVKNRLKHQEPSNTLATHRTLGNPIVTAVAL